MTCQLGSFLIPWLVELWNFTLPAQVLHWPFGRGSDHLGLTCYILEKRYMNCCHRSHNLTKSYSKFMLYNWKLDQKLISIETPNHRPRPGGFDGFVTRSFQDFIWIWSDIIDDWALKLVLNIFKLKNCNGTSQIMAIESSCFTNQSRSKATFRPTPRTTPFTITRPGGALAAARPDIWAILASKCYQ